MKRLYSFMCFSAALSSPTVSMFFGGKMQQMQKCLQLKNLDKYGTE